LASFWFWQRAVMTAEVAGVAMTPARLTMAAAARLTPAAAAW
jgi:hypothetical protein